jgi:hypothetical protein
MGMPFQRRKDGARDSRAAHVGNDIEAFDLDGPVIQHPQSATAYRLPGTLLIGHQEHGSISFRRRRSGLVIGCSEPGIQFCLLGCSKIGTHGVRPGDLTDVETRVGLHDCLDSRSQSPKGYATQD